MPTGGTCVTAGRSSSTTGRSHLLMLTGALCLFSGNSALAQIIPDNTLGAESSVITTTQPTVDRIDGGAIRGANLFHSLREFNIGEGRGAYFSNPTGILNILTRVTGNNRSNILGTLGVNGNANLFLVNPNGIFFGPNARLDVRGSFLASSANSLVFDNQFEFSATNPEAPPLLTVNIPIGLRFRENPGSIVNQSRATASSGEIVGLSVEPGKTIGLIGGEVSLEGGQLQADSGRIELGSVTGNSLVNLTASVNGFALGYEQVENFGDIQLSQGSVVDTSGAGGGAIQVMARQLSVLDGSQLISFTQGDQPGGDVTVRALAGVEVSGMASDGSEPSRVSSQTQGTGSAGNLAIDTAQLIVNNGIISAASFGAGASGNLTVRATDSVDLSAATVDGLPRGLVNSALDAGNAGDTIIETGRLTVRDGATVLAGTRSAGNGGNLTIRADTVEVLGTSPDGLLPTTIQSSATQGSESIRQRLGPSVVTGNGGNLTIETGQLIVSDGGLVSAGNEGSGIGGKLTVLASDLVKVSGTSADSLFFSRLSSDITGTGPGGDLTIETGRLQVLDRAMVSTFVRGAGAGGNLTVRASDSVEVSGIGFEYSNTITIAAFLGTLTIPFLNSGLYTATDGAGKAGNITIDTRNLTVRDGSLIATPTFSSGAGGDINIRASEKVEGIGSIISTTSLIGSTGKGGNLTIEAKKVIVRDGAIVVVTTFASGDGGNMLVRASESVELLRTPSGAQASTGLGSNSIIGTGAAGDITIETPRLIIRDGARVPNMSGAIVPGGTIPLGGPGGDTVVNASELVEITGVSPDGVFESAIDSETFTPSRAGNLSLSTKRLILRDGARLVSSTEQAGRGGSLTIRASEGIELSGTSSIGQFFRRTGLFASSGSNLFQNSEASGAAGDLRVTTRELIVRDGAQVAVSSVESGDAGVLEIAADFLRLDNGAAIDAATVSGAGGSMLLRTRDIQLRRGSNITTNAGSADGGNITLDTETLVALENSDITANARAGRGGQVIINATGVFGTEFRQQATLNSDITASSDLGASFSGTVTISTPDVDPSSGLVQLAQNVVDVTGLIGQNPCTRGTESAFIITGKGGLPPNPAEPLSPNSVVVDWATLEGRRQKVEGVREELPMLNAKSSIVPARGWVFNDNGEVVLTSYDSTGTSGSREWLKLPTCGDR